MPLKQSIALLKQGYAFVRENDFKTIASAIHSKDAHPTIQFLKYAVCGVLATVATMGTWFALSVTVLPAMDWLVVDGVELSENKELRARNSTINNVIGWVFGNLVAYFTNVLWVFQAGRHSKTREFLYFTAVSAIATLAGLAAGPLLIQLFGIPTLLSQGTFLVTAVLVNYVCRKFFIFHG